MNKLTNIDSSLLETLYEEHHTVGPGEAWSLAKRELNEENTHVLDAIRYVVPRNLQLTTRCPSLGQIAALLHGENIFSTCSQTVADGKSYVMNVTMKKPNEKMQSEGKSSQMDEYIIAVQELIEAAKKMYYGYLPNGISFFKVGDKVKYNDERAIIGEINEFEVISVHDDNVHFDIKDCDGLMYGYLTMANFELVDDKDGNKDKTCTCDFYSVIMVSGCICGGS